MAPSNRSQNSEYLARRRKRTGDSNFLADLSMDFFPRRQFLESVAEEDMFSDVAATEPTPALSVSGSADGKRDCMPAYVKMRSRRGARFPSNAVKKLELFHFVQSQQHLGKAPPGLEAIHVKPITTPQSEPAQIPRPPGLLECLNSNNAADNKCFLSQPNPESIHRLIHELACRSACKEQATQEHPEKRNEEVPVVMNLSELPGLLAGAAEPAPRNVQESDPSEISSVQTSTSKKIKADYIHVRYSVSNGDDESPTGLVLVAGATARIAANVQISFEKQGALEGHLRFAVSPPLPKGLTICKRSGLISGVPEDVQERPSAHEISIGISASGVHGTPLGILQLTCCSILIRIIDLSHYVQSPTVSSNAENDAVVVKLRKSCLGD